jgi:pilus assembly protein Flp/PilA
MAGLIAAAIVATVGNVGTNLNSVFNYIKGKLVAPTS